jgi:hypothetical protein
MVLLPFLLVGLLVFGLFKYHFGISAVRTYVHVRAAMDSALVVEDKYIGLWGFVILGSGPVRTDADLVGAGIPLGDYVIQKFKIIVSLSQVISQMSTGFKVDWPEDFSRLLDSLSFVNLNIFSFPAVGCLAETNFIGVFLAMTSLPLLFALLVLCCYPFWKIVGLKLQKGIGRNTPLSSADGASGELVRQKAAKEFGVNIMIKMCLGTLFIVYPGVSNIVLRMFHCRTLANGESYLAADLSISCNSNEPLDVAPGFSHMGYLDYRAWAVVMICVYPIGVPLLFFVVLWMNRHQLYDKADGEGQPSTLNARCYDRYGMIYEQYEERFWYWEVVELIRKLMLTSIIIFFWPESAMQVEQ